MSSAVPVPVSVSVAKAPCGCNSVLLHLPSCRLVHGDAAKCVSDRIFCDVEDGCVWIHVGDNVAPLTPKAARDFGDQMHECAREAARHA